MKATFHAPGTTDLACKLCGVAQRVEMEKDEDGGLYAELETEPCHADNCHKQLCRNCPQFECVCCKLTHCMEHAEKINGKMYCPIGAAEYRKSVELTSARVCLALARYVRGELGGAAGVN